MENNPPQPTLLLTATQAAESLAISPRKLWSMTQSGEVPHIRLGRCLRYPADDLRLWIDDQKKGASSTQSQIPRDPRLPVSRDAP